MLPHACDADLACAGREGNIERRHQPIGDAIALGGFHDIESVQFNRAALARVVRELERAQVGEAVTNMDQTTQQNAALVEEMAAAAASLRNQAQELVQAVSVFKLS